MRSLERAFDVLAAIEDAGTAVRMTEISQQTRLHLSTVTRILGVLIRRGYVEQDGAGRYRLGPLHLTGSYAYLTTDTRNRLARPIIQSLADITGATASFYVRHDLSRILTVRVDGEHPLRYEIPIGRRLPLHLGAGKVLAAYLDDDELDEFFAQTPDLAHASGKQVTESEFRANLETIRSQGYWHAIEERAAHTESLSVPVRAMNEYQRPGAVIIARRMGAEGATPMGQWVDELKMAAQAIEQLRD